MENIDIGALKQKMNSNVEGLTKESYKSKDSNKKKSSRKNSGTDQNGFERSDPENCFVTAPYNFIPFHTKTIPVEQLRMENHDKMEEGLLTGEISYTMTAKTPIFVDDGTEQHDFVRNAWNKYALPGSTVRGLIRSNVQILGVSGFEDDIDDYRLMYRNVASGAERGRYKEILGSAQIPVNSGKINISVLLNVKAGYIAKMGDHYVIYRTKVDKISDTLQQMNYYVLNERFIADNPDNFPYFKSNPSVLQHDVSKGFIKEEKGKKVQYKGIQNKNYQPGYYPVSYQVKNLNNISAVAEQGELENQGYLACTGNVQMKKALYIIPEIDKTKSFIEVSSEDEKAFRIDFEKKKNTLKRFKNVEFFNLPEENEEKPVFYIKEGDHLYFGFTPSLRLFYDHTVKEGYRQEISKFDYAKSLFGTVDGKTGYKSKLSFSDAVVQDTVRHEAKRTVILAEPKPTSYLDYLKQNKEMNTYNTDEFELRGVKQYWLHKNIDIPVFLVRNENEEVYSVINALKKGTVFKGFIRFQNLTRAELGLLVWSLCLKRDCWMNVGKAKAYGFGAVSVSDVIVKTLNLKKAYRLEAPLYVKAFVDPFETEDIDSLIKTYKEEVSGKLGRPIEELKPIKDFFIMKDSKRIPDKAKTEYLELKKYQSRKQPLPEVSQVVSTTEKSNK